MAIDTSLQRAAGRCSDRDGHMPEEIIETEPIALYEKQLNESEKAFAAFVIYRDASTDRTYQLVANKLQCTNHNIQRWAVQWNWRERALAWDREMDEKHRAAMAKGRMDMRERQAKIGAAMQGIATYALVELQNRMDGKLPLNLTTDEITRMMDVGARMESRARGEEREGRFTKINVILRRTPPDDEKKAAAPLVLDGEVTNPVN
jgi:hypothetical protein